MKKQNRKRILSMFVTAVMLFSLFSQPFTLGVVAESYVASVTVGDTTTPYTSLSDALTAWVDGSTLKLLDNFSSQISVNGGTRTLDINGHNISRSGTVIVATNANLTLTDSSASPGTLSNTSTSGGSVIECNGGTLTMSNIKATSKYNGMGLANCTATIYSGQISVTSAWKTIFNVGDGSNLTVYDGTFQSANHMVAYLTGSGAATFEGGSFKGSFSDTAVVHGGYFDRDVSNLCPEGYACVTSDDSSKGAYMIQKLHQHNGVTFTEWTSTNSLPTEAGNYYLTGDVTISSSWNVPEGTTNLCLNGYGIRITSNESAIKASGRTLNIYSCSSRTHYITLTDWRGTAVSDSGEEVPVVDGNGVVKVDGGYITGGNTCKTGTERGGALYANSGSHVTLNNVTIIGNESTFGGALFLNTNGTVVTYNDCAIIYNYGGDGSMVRMDEGHLVLNDTLICNNVSYNRGCICAYWGRGISISGNTQIYDNYLHKNDTVTEKNLHMGKPVGYNRLESFTVSDLAPTARIGLSMDEAGLFVQNWTEAMGDADPNDYFFSDDSAYLIGKNADGQLLLGTPAKVTYNANGATGGSVPAVSGTTYAKGSAVVIADNTGDLAWTGFVFTGWNTKADGSGTNYNAGDLVTISADTTLYAQWDHTHDGLDVVFKKWISTSSLPTSAGNYYLTGDVTISSTWSAPGGTKLCLNGHTITKTGNGSVISISGGTLALYDGTITGGTHSERGGAIYISGANVTLNGITITGNSSDYGGGLYMNNSTVTLNDCVITDNCVDAYNSQWGGCGGAIYADNSCTLVLNGTKIYGNYSTYFSSNGNDSDDRITSDKFSGVTGSFAVIKISGNTQIYDNYDPQSSGTFDPEKGIQKNLFIQADGAVQIIGALDDTAKIGVGRMGDPWTSWTTGVVTSGWSTYMEGKDPADYFFSDNDDYIVKLDGGEACLVPAHVHSWTYTADGNVITATCTGEGTCDLESQTLTLNVTGKTYDKTAVTATISKSANWDAYGLAAPSEITYTGNTNAGTYTASVTVGGKTATAEFTIAKKTLTVTADAKEKTYGNADPTFTYTASGLIGTDALAGALTRATGENVGTYAITQGTLTAGDNYTITYTGANLTINAAPMSVSASGYTGDYDGEAHGITVTVTNPEGAIVKYGTKSGEYTLDSAPTYTNAGTYTVYYQVTKDNYITSTGSAVVTINKINATVTIVGNNSTVDYDGTEHTVTGYVATASTPLYDVTKDFTFDGAATAKRTNAGTTNMGLAASQFANNNANFATVTFNVTDGYQTINKINATVTITGNNSTVDYDGTEHIVTGYVAEASTALYDVTKDFTFDGAATAKRTNAGTTNMGLAASQFANNNANFATVTFNVTDGYQTINKINATVTITGNNSTVDYDGTAHTVMGYVATASTALYDVTKDFTFGGTATATQTNAGTTNMGLAAGQFANNNANFATVTFNVTDGYQTINKINAVVTIEGDYNVCYYDGNAHTVSGYVATASTPLYDVDNDIVFTGTAQALRTNVGTSMMTLKAGDFANRNPNFSTVTFVVTNGYQTIAATPAVIRTEPKAKSLIYDGTYQELVTAGEADGGTIYYAVTQTPSEQPADTQYHTFLPLAKAKGTYYVWYRVKSDANHTDLSATFLKVILLSNAETTLTGRLYQSDGQTPVVGATVSLKRGNKIINSVLTDEDGRYEFAVLDGSYNLVAEHNGMTQTAMVMIEGSKTQDMILSAGKTESFLKVSAKADDFGVVAGGLDEEAVAIRAIEQIPDGSSVSVTMTVETKTEETAVNADPINDLAEPTKSLTFFDIKVEKTIDSVTTRIEETTKILEIAIPYEKAVKRGVTVYSSDGTGVQALQESDSKENGTYRVDRANGLVYIYSNSFSTFAIGYTPYYHLAGSLSLGSSFRGTANVTLTSQTDGAVYQLEGVALDNISFADIPKGPYMMTITWEDGTKNSITMPFTVSYNNKED